MASSIDLTQVNFSETRELAFAPTVSRPCRLTQTDWPFTGMGCNTSRPGASVTITNDFDSIDAAQLEEHLRHGDHPPSGARAAEVLTRRVSRGSLDRTQHHERGITTMKPIGRGSVPGSRGGRAEPAHEPPKPKKMGRGSIPR